MRRKTKVFLPEHFLLLIDKVPGRTSHDETARIRAGLSRLGIEAKVGHSGTLDPKVSGLLVVGVGKATKLLERVLESPKTYTGVLEIHKSIERKVLEEALKRFTGKIEQLPPQKSSVKRVLRTRFIYGLEILEFSGRETILRCTVERGTYIRKLFHDIGEYMETGASMGDLRRTGVAHFDIEDPRATRSDELLALIDAASSKNIFRRNKSIKEIRLRIVQTHEILESHKILRLERGVTTFLASGSDLYVPGVFSVESGVVAGDKMAIFDGELLVALGTAEMTAEEMRIREKGTAVTITKRLIP